MINIKRDVLGSSPLFVFDCEWVGELSLPHAAHLTEIAVYSVRTAATYHALCRPLASNVAVSSARSLIGLPEKDSGAHVDCAQALAGMLQFVQKEATGFPPVFIAHNGIRYDVPVLLHSMRRCNLVVPPQWKILDSLHHTRFQMKYRQLTTKFSIPQLCAVLEVEVDRSMLHGALYDTMLLHRILYKMSEKWSVPYISGYPQPMCALSTMLVHGVGPTVCVALGGVSLHELCTTIVNSHGSLDAGACKEYLTKSSIEAKLPMANIQLIADGIEQAAIRYLHYLP